MGRTVGRVPPSSHLPSGKNDYGRLTVGRTLLRLAELGIAAICAHTNLDAAQGGVNDVLAHRLALVDTAMLHQDGTDCQGRPYGIGRVGRAHQEGLDACSTPLL